MSKRQKIRDRADLAKIQILKETISTRENSENQLEEIDKVIDKLERRIGKK